MTTAGYYRFPTIHDDTVVFVCEDDLWTVSTRGGIARRLTSNLGEASMPALSPDGRWLAYSGREEGAPDVYVMPAVGGPATRLTYLGATTEVVGWTPDGESIVYASNAGRPFMQEMYLWAISPPGGEPQALPTGPAVNISFGADGGRVIGRNASDLYAWKRYRGGRAGDIWIDVAGDGQWRRLIRLEGNLARPLWLGERVYFISDHEGIGNLYSCLPWGDDLRRHTQHDEYYVRDASSDGRRIVYASGGDLYLYDPAEESSRRLDFEFHSPRVQRNRKFVPPARFLQDYAVHPEGHSVALVSRGQSFTMANWEAAVVQHGEPIVQVDGVPVAVRHRLTTWLHDGKRLVLVGDAEGEEALEVHPVNGGGKGPRRLGDLDIGRPVQLVPSPRQDLVALSNHRNELILVDLDAGSARVLDRSPYGRLRGLAWAPDGRWLAYGFPNSSQTSIIKLASVESGETWEVTRTVLRDEEPAFDPEGKYLYFLSARDFDPVYDALQFDLNFPRGMRPYLLTLRRDLPSPFVPQPRAPGQKTGKGGNGEDDEDEEDGQDDGDGGVLLAETDVAAGEAPQEDALPAPGDGGTPSAASTTPPLGDDDAAEEEAFRIDIDLEGIGERMVAFPVDDARYSQIRGIRGRVLYSWWPVEGALGNNRRPGQAPSANAVLEMYDFGEQKQETLVEGISSFELSADAKTLIYRAGNRLRMLRAGEKPDNKAGSNPSRQSGWLDLSRLKVAVIPGAEWAQMYRQAWRLQRDQFWTEDMGGVDWPRVFLRYWPLVARIATRSEFSDLMWEMQGELGTSHAYEFGGDYRPEPRYDQGFLGADLAWDEAAGGYRVLRLVHGDPWDESADSPLNGAGINVAAGDVLLAVSGRRLSREVSPAQVLVNQAGEEVQLTFAGRPRNGGRSGNRAEPWTVTVRTLDSERDARYREWVENNRRLVHRATDGRVGYIHVPDMGPAGYAEFHRGYLAEVTREGLIVDVRFNRGGSVSQLLLEKLARRRIGYDVQRWGQPDPYPIESVLGPMVALTNEYAGSDGDIFSHAFKLMGLGPLIGKRTWGGVIGIWVRDALVDGSVTTQPEFSFYFEDVGWGVENYGTDPDIEVEITPQDYVAGRDPQMERALAEIRQLLEEAPPQVPDFSERPRLALPTLPR